MAAITWTDVTNHATNLTTVAAGAQNDILNYVNNVHDVSLLGGESGYDLKLARIYLAAHLGTVAPTASAGGQIKSSSAGGLSRSYGPFASAEVLKSTSWGIRYLDIIEGSAARGPFII